MQTALAKLWFPPSATADSGRLLTTRALRGFADGIASVLLPAYLTAIGFSSLQIAAIVFATLIGSAALALWVGFVTNRLGRRRALLGACILMVATGLGFALVTSFWPLFIVAVVGTLNPSSGDVSLFLPVEQSALAETVTTRDLTAIFSRYNVGGAFAGAFGALVSGLPALLAPQLGWSRSAALSLGFIVYSALGIAAAMVYRGLTPAIETSTPKAESGALVKSRRIVFQLSALFSLDSFGGGFVVQSLLALWLFRRFNLSLAAAGSFFFVGGLLGAGSQLVSSWLAARIGRINTMVFTHIPASIFVILAAFMPNLQWTLFFLLLRFALSSMDVPARQSFVMAVVPPEERAAAASVTNVPRSLATAVAPLPAGLMLDHSLFGWPLVCAGMLKIAYDLLLLRQFRAVKPADEIS
jgi:MFS family permease